MNILSEVTLFYKFICKIKQFPVGNLQKILYNRWCEK